MGRSAVGADGEDFDVWYRSYPRHKKIQDARKAWRQTEKARPSLEQMLAILEQRKRGEWRGKDPQFIPYPATYLRAHSWLDEEDPEPELDYKERRERLTGGYEDRAPGRRTPQRSSAEQQELRRRYLELKRTTQHPDEPEEDDGGGPDMKAAAASLAQRMIWQ